MIRAAPWEVLGTSAAAGRSARGRGSGCVRTPKPPQRKLQRWRLAHHSTPRRDRDNEAVLSRAVHPEWRTGGAVGRKIAAASRRDHLPRGPLQARSTALGTMSKFDKRWKTCERPMRMAKLIENHPGQIEEREASEI